jgi:hypothetical protein
MFIAVGWLGIAGFLVLQAWPEVPYEKTGWLILIALGPPFFVFGEALFSWLLSPKHGGAISQNRLSGLRVLLAFPLALTWFALCWWLSLLIWH